ncbi:dsDNA nuclease domain-containing protein [Rhizobium sp. Rhizsp42]|uniref:dsDNA nuclease domain-containing protein n=1 Tax=Rhizobium sp. Rhizsp42 TaxID=3243034 RepID=UPI0039B1228F
MNLTEDLTRVPERETGGKTAQERLDYQTAWGLLKLLELHEKGRGYAVAFEFHDDIAELDDISAPKVINFYQVKTTKSGSWSLAQIAQLRGKTQGSKSSYAGRMFDNLVRFGNAVSKVSFVTNRPLTDYPSAVGEVPMSGADAKKLKKFVSALKLECPRFDEHAHLPLYGFLECGLDLQRFEETLLGETTLFLERMIGGGEHARIFHLMLSDECRRKSRRLSDLASLDELLRSKFLTREDIDSRLASFKRRRDNRPAWSSVSGHLHLPWREEMALERAWRAYETRRLARVNASMFAFEEKLRNAVADTVNSAQTLMQGVSAALAVARPLVEEAFGPVDDDFVKAAILYEYQR